MSSPGSFLEFLTGISLFALGFDLFLYHRPSHPLFQVGGVMLFTGLFPLIHTLTKAMK
ncbi:MAG: hypothetical protein JRN20_11150 [Nitrososphaerota archaeon]|nr:hypothetical protein [Nitrososphaerota archaeon]